MSKPPACSEGGVSGEHKFASMGNTADGDGVGVWFNNADASDRTCTKDGTAGGVSASIRLSRGVVSSGAAGEDAKLVVSVPIRRNGNWPSDVCERGRGRLGPLFSCCCVGIEHL